MKKNKSLQIILIALSFIFLPDFLRAQCFGYLCPARAELNLNTLALLMQPNYFDFGTVKWYLGNAERRQAKHRFALRAGAGRGKKKDATSTLVTLGAIPTRFIDTLRTSFQQASLGLEYQILSKNGRWRGHLGLEAIYQEKSSYTVALSYPEPDDFISKQYYRSLDESSYQKGGRIDTGLTFFLDQRVSIGIECAYILGQNEEQEIAVNNGISIRNFSYFDKEFRILTALNVSIHF